MLFVPPFSLDSAEEVCGDYTRERLEAMDAAFVAAVELAFAKGLESRVAAAASVRVGYRNGQQYTEAAIEEAWRYLRTNMDAGILWRGCELVHLELLLSACARGLGGGSLLGLEKCDDQLGRACEASARGRSRTLAVAVDHGRRREGKRRKDECFFDHGRLIRRRPRLCAKGLGAGFVLSGPRRGKLPCVTRRTSRRSRRSSGRLP